MKTSKNDIVDALEIISIYYNLNYGENLKTIAGLWYLNFKDTESQDFKQAVNQALSTSKWAITIAHVKEILETKEQALLNKDAIWNDFEKELRKFFNLQAELRFYEADVELIKSKLDHLFNNQHASIQVFFGNYQVICDLGKLDDKAFSYEKVRYLKEFDTLIEKSKNLNIEIKNNVLPFQPKGQIE